MVTDDDIAESEFDHINRDNPWGSGHQTTWKITMFYYRKGWSYCPRTKAGCMQSEICKNRFEAGKRKIVDHLQRRHEKKQREEIFSLRPP